MSNLNANQKRLLIIIALFFVPLSIAMLWYFLLPAGYIPKSTTNNGNLIIPAYSVQAFEQKTHTGETYTGKDLETKWTLVHLVEGVCDEACSKALYNTRQIRIALAEDMDRVNRLTVVNNTESAAENNKMWASHPDMKILVATENGLAHQINHNAKQPYPANSVFLIDPLGNLMMQFPPDLEPKKLMKDVEKLLKLSRIG